ncbi:ArsR/SmtB family transcription factor [Amphibacillus jilinensis]|uniref:ArsR/SmtB family transcription factor n=1 Tax=Amphibacillus jilinensis TaxID=1216008 RepID=UPI0002D54B4B|nr:metalloregulator ArsR/SmtB family transcription factor [Amphibacillus jilinensis]
MDILQLTSKKRETYNVKLNYSTLWECALGIAAITNTKLITTLDQPSSYWQQLKQSMTTALQDELKFVEENNTWKALLQLLHRKTFTSLAEFVTYIEDLEAYNIRYQCLPFIGHQYETYREGSAKQDKHLTEQFVRLTESNPFFPQYITFISQVDISLLKKHLVTVMCMWYEEIIAKSLEETEAILKNDYQAKEMMKKKLTPEELVQWATGGITYLPEPSVHTVLLIPQYIYRPWTIEADIEGIKVFYYPVSNESISPDDKYTPNHFLVLKHKALGDEIRLKITKMLSEKSRTLQDITERLDVGKSTIHHHLKILRAAKLVEIIDSKYVLKKDALELLFKELAFYLDK